MKITAMNIDPEVDSMLRGIYATAKSNLERDGMLRAMMFIETPRGMNIIDLHNGLANKDALAGVMRQVVRQLKATSIITVMEAWVTMRNPDQIKKDRFGKPDIDSLTPPSQDPQKQEAVFLNLMCNNDPGIFSIMAMITRDENNKPTIPSTMPNPEHMSNALGRFGNPWFS